MASKSQHITHGYLFRLWSGCSVLSTPAGKDENLDAVAILQHRRFAADIWYDLVIQQGRNTFRRRSNLHDQGGKRCLAAMFASFSVYYETHLAQCTSIVISLRLLI